MWTAFLFTKSDIKTVLIPVVRYSIIWSVANNQLGMLKTCLALASSPHIQSSCLLGAVFWIWIHLLYCDLVNQTLAPEEDFHNKKDWPIPSGRLSIHTANIVCWPLLLFCLAWSASYHPEVLYASVSFCTLTYIYNEMGYAAGHWVGRNLLNAFVYVNFEMGACLILSKCKFIEGIPYSWSCDAFFSRQDSWQHYDVICTLQLLYCPNDYTRTRLQGYYRR